MLVENVTHLLNALVMVRRNSRVSGGLTSMRSCFEAASKVVTTLRAGMGTVGMSSSDMESGFTLGQRLRFGHNPTIKAIIELPGTPA